MYICVHIIINMPFCMEKMNQLETNLAVLVQLFISLLFEIVLIYMMTSN